VVMEVPVGACEGFAGRQFEEDGFDVAVHVVCGLIGKAGDEFFDDEGEEEVLVVDVVEGEHGAAVEEELLGDGLEAELFEGQAEGLVGAFGGALGAAGAGGGGDGEEEKAGERPAEEAMRCRVGWSGNRHGLRRVSHVAGTPLGGQVHVSRVRVLFHRRGIAGNVYRCDERPLRM
jgi:hypothetical protein